MGWRRWILVTLLAVMSGLSGWLFVMNSQVPGSRFLAAFSFITAVPPLWAVTDHLFLTDFSLAEELSDGNVAYGIVVGLVFVGLCLLVGLTS
jgi:hypothetical protein